MMDKSLLYRTDVRPDDLTKVKEIVSSTGFFHPEEIDIAVELVDERLQKGLQSGYHFIFADMGERTVGYGCFGPIPATQFSYDLYWIAVHADFRGKGIGKVLLRKCEEAINTLGGQRVYIETSGRELYVPTRQFYLRCDYEEAAVLDDFYAPGDAKYIYVRTV